MPKKAMESGNSIRTGAFFMKKNLPFISIILFPYFVAFALICIFTGTFMNTVFNNNIFMLLAALFLLYFVALACAIYVFIRGLTKKQDAHEILRINMLIKLVHIPAYLLIFVVGVICTITIFTIVITVLLMILDVMTIVLSGLVGLSGVIVSFKEKKISAGRAVLHGMLQFVYCGDIISSIVLFRTVKADS